MSYLFQLFVIFIFMTFSNESIEKFFVSFFSLIDILINILGYSEKIITIKLFTE